MWYAAYALLSSFWGWSILGTAKYWAPSIHSQCNIGSFPCWNTCIKYQFESTNQVLKCVCSANDMSERYSNSIWMKMVSLLRKDFDSRFIIDQNRCIRYVVLWMIYVWNWCFIDFFIRSDFLRSKRSILKRQKTWWIKLQRRYCHIISQNWCLNLYFNLIRWSYTTNRC